MACVLATLYKVWKFAQSHFFSTVDVKRKYAKAGTWAVVTGASDGIGRGMALELAKRGMNVALIARTKSKLDEVAAEVTKMNVEARVICFDFSKASAADYSSLFAELDKLSIAVLVNNVGVNYDYPMLFDAAPLDEDLRMLKVNCETPVQMTKYVVPKMKAKRCGAIIYLASVSAVMGCPMLSTYAGTKAFNLVFGNCMNVELKEYGIDVLTVTPNFVISHMSQMRRETFTVVAPGPMARQTLDQLGTAYQTSGHWQHGFMEAFYALIPKSMRDTRVLGSMKKLSAKSQKKRSEEGAKH